MAASVLCKLSKNLTSYLWHKLRVMLPVFQGTANECTLFVRTSIILRNVCSTQLTKYQKKRGFSNIFFGDERKAQKNFFHFLFVFCSILHKSKEGNRGSGNFPTSTHSFCSQHHYITKCMLSTIDRIPEISCLKKPIFRGYIADSNRDYLTVNVLCFLFVFCC